MTAHARTRPDITHPTPQQLHTPASKENCCSITQTLYAIPRHAGRRRGNIILAPQPGLSGAVRIHGKIYRTFPRCGDPTHPCFELTSSSFPHFLPSAIHFPSPRPSRSPKRDRNRQGGPPPWLRSSVQGLARDRPVPGLHCALLRMMEAGRIQREPLRPPTGIQQTRVWGEDRLFAELLEPVLSGSSVPGFCFSLRPTHSP